MPSPRVRAATAAGLSAVAVLVAGCAHRSIPGTTVVKTVVVTPTPTPTSTPTPTPTPTPSSSAASSPTPTKPPAPKHTKLQGTCSSLLPLTAITRVVGTKLPGFTAFAVGASDPTIGRLSYLNCKYGDTHARGPAVEITVSVYDSVKDAYGRISQTTQDFVGHGATASATKVSRRPATLLLGANMLSYGPTVVLPAGIRTVAVTLRPGTTNPTPTLRALAATALHRTAFH